MKEIFSPAKINLGLKVLNKREDGYHNLQSIFLPIGFGDVLFVEELPEKKSFEITIDSKNLNSESAKEISKIEKGNLENNLVFKVWKEFLSEKSYRVHIQKNIPLGGGLGGGSSNAGSFLKSFLTPDRLHTQDTIARASKIGADIPFFLYSTPCFVEGIGEVITPISVAKGMGILTIFPFTTPTGPMFQTLNRSLHLDPFSKPRSGIPEKVQKTVKLGAWKDLSPDWENDFTQISFQFQPLLETIHREFLREGAVYSSLTGTGSSLYGLFSSETERAFVLERMVKKFPSLKFVPFEF